jgi:type I restriction enzyme S subunit
MQVEIRPGYMRTEVGFIPEDWRVATLGELCNFENGDRGVNYPSGSDFVLSGVPFVNAGHLKRGRIAFDKLDFITRSKFETLGNGKFHPGDVLFCLRGSLGKFAVVDDDTPEGAVASSLIIIRPRPKSLALQFLVAYLDSKICGDMIELWAGGAAQPNLGGRELARFFVPVPPSVEEQLSIATALADADGLIAALEGMIAKKRDLKQAAMQHLLTGKTRLPGFSGEWEVKRLGEIFDIGSSKRVFQSEWRTQGVPFYRAREIVLLADNEAIENQLFVSRDLYESHKANSGVPEVGDMLVTGVGTLGRVFVVESDQEFYFKDGNIIWFKIRGKMSASFLRQLFLTEEIMRQIKDSAGGSTVGTYTISGAKKTVIPFPSLSEQTAIAEVLSDMDADLSALEAQAAKARAVKQGMMQELLTGRVRLV